MSFTIKLKYKNILTRLSIKPFLGIVKFFILLNFLLFSLSTIFARIYWEKLSLKLLNLEAKLDLGICNFAEYQLATIFMYHLNYEAAFKYYMQAALSPLSCVRSMSYYNIGVIYANLGYGLLQKKFPFGTLDSWIISLGAFKRAVAYGERSKMVSVERMQHNIHVIQYLMYKNCVNVCHPGCPAKACKEALDAVKKQRKQGDANDQSESTANSGNQVDAHKIQAIEKRQKKAIAEQQKNADRKRWLDKATKGDYTQGW